jgi:predicted acetylornithine/succinylornithine family transaminase
VTTYNRSAFCPVAGSGARILNADGRAFWDLFAGIAVNALGHGHPRIVGELKDAAAGLLHTSNLYRQPWQALLAEMLVEKSGLSRVFFCNSGTEANEAAIKFARIRNPGRSKIVALQGGFHGRTLGALSVTGSKGYRDPFEPLVPGAHFVEPEDAVSLRAVAGSDTSAIILEPILGEGGVVPLSAGFLRAARELCDRSGAVLIFDEIQCGLGRTGSLFAFQESGVTPDIVTLAKPLGGGLPLGALIAGPALEGVVKPGHHGSTFGGNPVACRLGIAVLDEVSKPSTLARVKRIGDLLGSGLSGIAGRVGAVKEVRGRGLMWGIELNSDAAPVAAQLFEKGFVVGTAQKNVIRLLPPFVVPVKAVKSFLAVFESILSEVAS